jgi:hypothetical protein
MDRFLEYATSLDPTFPSRIEGATASEIDQLERAVAGPLPPDYRAYLELMGRRDDGIIGGDEFLTSATDLVDYYETSVGSGDVRVPADCIVFGAGYASIEALYLDREAPHGIFESDDGAKGTMWTPSLRVLLYQQAFMRAAARRHAHTTVLSGAHPAPRQRRAERLLGDLELKRLWFSDETTLCYESADDRVAVHRGEESGCGSRPGGSSASGLSHGASRALSAFLSGPRRKHACHTMPPCLSRPSLFSISAPNTRS